MRVIECARPQDLDRHQSVEQLVPRQQHRAHAALSKHALDLVLASQGGSNLERHDVSKQADVGARFLRWDWRRPPPIAKGANPNSPSQLGSPQAVGPTQRTAGKAISSRVAKTYDAAQSLWGANRTGYCLLPAIEAATHRDHVEEPEGDRVVRRVPWQA